MQAALGHGRRGHRCNCTFGGGATAPAGAGFGIICSVFPRTLLLALVLVFALPAAAHAVVSTGDSPEEGGSETSRPTVSQEPAISGSATAGQQLTADPGAWDPPSPPFGTMEPLDYIWLRCSAGGTGCAPVAGATLTYDLTGADVGQVIKFRVRGTGEAFFMSGYRERDATSVVIAAAPPGPSSPSGPAAPTNVTAPTISGDAREGQSVRASQGEWTGTDPITYSYGWVSCSTTCRAVSGSSAYRVRRRDVGRRLVVSVYAHNAVGSTKVEVSTGVVARPFASSNLARLSPFPTLLVDGRVAGALTSISTLRLRRVPGGSTINVKCGGQGCPFRRSRVKVRSGGRRTIALRRLQRRMRAGTVVVITVRKGNTLGKYIRLRFRNGLAPARVDRCVAPNSSKPLKCP